MQWALRHGLGFGSSTNGWWPGSRVVKLAALGEAGYGIGTTMWLSSFRRRISGAVVVTGLLVLGACNPKPVGVVDDDAGSDAGVDAPADSGKARDASADASAADGPSDTGTE
jgi:hypothetical protein